MWHIRHTLRRLMILSIGSGGLRFSGVSEDGLLRDNRSENSLLTSTAANGLSGCGFWDTAVDVPRTPKIIPHKPAITSN